MRTVFMVEGAIDADRLNRDLERARRRAYAAACAGTVFRTTRSRSRWGSTAATSGRGTSSGSRSPVRYVRRRCARGVPPAPRAGVRPRLPGSDRDRERAGNRDRETAEDPGRARRRPARSTRPRSARGRASTGATAASPPLPTRYFERSRLPIGEAVAGPAIVFQRDTTVLVPPDWSATAARGTASLSCPVETEMSVARTRIDPVTTAVIGGALDSIAVEMGHKLARMSYSSIIRESEDFGCAICDHEARQLCESSAVDAACSPGQSPATCAGSTGASPSSAKSGDRATSSIHNHAYYGASHGPDVALRAYRSSIDGELVAFSATTAHHLDLGALTPGTCGIVDATDAYAEGLQFNAIKIEEEGRRNEWMWRLLRDNIRAAQLVVGDMEAQLAACRIGAERFVELLERYGVEHGAGGERGSDGLLRADAPTARSRSCPDGDVHGRGHPRRIPRPSRSGVPRPRGSGRRSRSTAPRSDRRPDRDVAAGRSADQHAVRGHRGHRGAT